jgi:hypothetical protein
MTGWVVAVVVVGWVPKVDSLVSNQEFSPGSDGRKGRTGAGQEDDLPFHASLASVPACCKLALEAAVLPWSPWRAASPTFSPALIPVV